MKLFLEKFRKSNKANPNGKPIFARRDKSKQERALMQPLIDRQRDIKLLSMRTSTPRESTSRTPSCTPTKPR